jgi:hypothetical protein
MFSAFHLANVGLQQYTVDLIEASKKIAAAAGSETICQPLPPFILGGTTNIELVRCMIELQEWAVDYFGDGENFLRDSHKVARDIFQELATGENKDDSKRRYVLPANTPNGKRVWTSGGLSRAMPNSLKAPTASQEMRMVQAIISELREKHGMNLDQAPRMDRALDPQVKPKRKADYLLVGSDNASMLSSALTHLGKSTSLLHSPGWTVTRHQVEVMAGLIARKLEEEDPAIVILQLLDNSMFYVKHEDGSRLLPRQGEDGAVHVEGELQVCPRDVQEDHFLLMRKVFESVGKRKCIWLAPLPRDVTAGCCNDVRHVQNRGDPYFMEDMLLKLDGVKRHMREYIHAAGKKNVKVFDPFHEVRDMPHGRFWDAEPRYPTNEAVIKMAEGIIKTATSMQDTSSGQHHQEGVPGMAAGQHYNYNQGNTRGRGHGHRGGRGGRGGREREEYRVDRRQGYNAEYDRSDQSGRHMAPEPHRSGRGARGGQYDYRARPY